MEEVKVMVADESHIKYIDTILTTIAEAAKKRGSGIAKRSPEYVATKMREAKAVIALQGDKFAGFSYIGIDSSPRLQRHRTGKAYQEPHIHTCPTAMATC